MYVTIGKGKCARCDILKTLLDEKDTVSDMTEMPHRTMTY